VTRGFIDIYGGKEPKNLPLYPIADAARITRLARATARDWVLGRRYVTRSGQQRSAPLIRCADPARGMLSFTNLIELHVLSVLRGKRVRMERIRSATKFIHERLGTEHPLADVDVRTDLVDIYVEYFGQLISASSAQAQLRPVVESYLHRIDRDERGIARRLFPVTRSDSEGGPRLIVIDPARRFGRPVLVKANVETATIAERFLAGDSTRALALDFAIDEAAIEEAIRFEQGLRSAA